MCLFFIEPLFQFVFQYHQHLSEVTHPSTLLPPSSLLVIFSECLQSSFLPGFAFTVITAAHILSSPVVSASAPQTQLSPQHPLQSIHLPEQVIAYLTNLHCTTWAKCVREKVQSVPKVTEEVAERSSIKPMAFDHVFDLCCRPAFPSDLLVTGPWDEKLGLGHSSALRVRAKHSEHLFDFADQQPPLLGFFLKQ